MNAFKFAKTSTLTDGDNEYRSRQLADRSLTINIQQNFNGSNTFGTMKICSRQG